MRVTLSDLAKIGSVIDTATASGANQVQGIQFTLSDEQAIRSQALREAALKARSDADVLAAALGLKVIRVLTVEENGTTGGPVRPVYVRSACHGGEGADTHSNRGASTSEPTSCLQWKSRRQRASLPKQKPQHTGPSFPGTPAAAAFGIPPGASEGSKAAWLEMLRHLRGRA